MGINSPSAGFRLVSAYDAEEWEADRHGYVGSSGYYERLAVEGAVGHIAFVLWIRLSCPFYFEIWVVTRKAASVKSYGT